MNMYKRGIWIKQYVHFQIFAQFEPYISRKNMKKTQIYHAKIMVQMTAIKKKKYSENKSHP